MKSLKTKVIMSAVVLVFALIATIGSTYAWFTVTTEVNVSGIQLTVQSDESLLFLIADSQTAGQLADASNYTTSVTNADFLLTTAYGTTSDTINDWRLGAVTAGTGETDGTNVSYTSLFTTSGTSPNQTQTVALRSYDYTTGLHSPGVANDVGGDYIMIQFYLLSQSSTSEKVVLQDLTVNPTTPTTSVVDEALRVATHPGTDDLGDGTTYLYTPDRVFSAVDPDYLFDFSTQPGYEATQDAGLDLVLDPTPTTGTQALLLADQSLFYSSGAVDSAVNTGTIGSAATIANLDSNTPTLMTIYIYLEGWDADTDANILNSAFELSFTFALQETS